MEFDSMANSFAALQVGGVVDIEEGQQLWVELQVLCLFQVPDLDLMEQLRNRQLVAFQTSFHSRHTCPGVDRVQGFDHAFIEPGNDGVESIGQIKHVPQ